MRSDSAVELLDRSLDRRGKRGDMNMPATGQRAAHISPAVAFARVLRGV
jgi:hypothetical protein